MINTARFYSYITGIMVIVFCLAMLFSAYLLYTIPGNVLREAGFGQLLSNTYWSVAIAFFTGLATLYMALTTKKEVVVYRERISEDKKSTDAHTDSNKNSISLETVQSLASDDQLCQHFLQAVCDQLEAGQGAYYEVRETNGTRKLTLTNGYALSVSEGAEKTYDFGEGLIGQSAAEGKTLYVDDIPEGYIKVISGLGSASPRYLLIVPAMQRGSAVGVVEIATFKGLGEEERSYVETAVKLLVEKFDVQQ